MKTDYVISSGGLEDPFLHVLHNSNNGLHVKNIALSELIFDKDVSIVSW